MQKLYEELAAWWPLMSNPKDYIEEAAFCGNILRSKTKIQVAKVLELGSGGGNNAYHLKTWFNLTLVDVSEGMLAISCIHAPYFSISLYK